MKSWKTIITILCAIGAAGAFIMSSHYTGMAESTPYQTSWQGEMGKKEYLEIARNVKHVAFACIAGAAIFGVLTIASNKKA